MRLTSLTVLAAFALAWLFARADARADEPKPPLRGVLVKPERVTAEALAAWKARGFTAVVVPLDESVKPRWGTISERVARAQLALWPWIEVARNPAMADAHPDWMAAIGAHHDDWRRRFPRAPKPKSGEVVKAWPWVPIGYTPAFEAHRARLKALLVDLPGAWPGVFLNDLQGGPSSCGCGNDQCRWALDYGSPPTAPKVPGDDVAARLVSTLTELHPGKTIVPVWVTECEPIDLPEAPGSTGLCGGVGCARGDCWPRYVRNWNPLVQAARGPIALAAWADTFHRDPDRWLESDLALFQSPPRNGTPLPAARTIAVAQAWRKPDPVVDRILERVGPTRAGCIVALDPVEQAWEPRIVAAPDAKR